VLNGKRIVVVLPAYNAQRTLLQTVRDIPRDTVDEVLLVDDGSSDQTIAIAKTLGMPVFVHERNLGYGANQKTCYTEALGRGADVVVMLHPDYQNEPRLVSAMAGMVASGVYDVVLGSRILGTTARSGGMPFYKYVANRTLTAFQNLMLGTKLSEFHTGYRAFARRVLETLPLRLNSDDFVFDNQMLIQAVAFGFSIGEISCPTRYFAEASSINFRRSVIYGLGVVAGSLAFRLSRLGLWRSALLDDSPTFRLVPAYYTEASLKIGQVSPPHFGAGSRE
jgi:glycosyltransferase involved in cell wall biosynthesis